MKVGVLLLAAGAIILASVGSYHVKTKFKIGGEGGWDYLIADSDARRRSSHGERREMASGANSYVRKLPAGGKIEDFARKIF